MRVFRLLRYRRITLPPMSDPTPRGLDTSALALRDALAAALAEHLQRSKSARDFARRLGLDKSIGWKLWRITTAPSAVAVLRVFPKSRGVAVMLEAVRTKARSRSLADEAARLALELLSLRSAAERESWRAGKPATEPRAPRAAVVAQLEAGFAAAVESAGFSVETRIGAFLLSPDASGDRVDVAACTLVDGPRCYRADVRAVVYAQSTTWQAKSTGLLPSSPASGLGDLPGLLPELSTPGIDASQFAPSVRKRDQPFREWSFVPRPGVPETLAFLEVSRGLGNIWAAEAHDFGSLFMAITAPMRRAVLDIWVHRAMPTPDFTVSFRYVEAAVPRPGAASRRLPSPFPDGVLLECRAAGLGSGMGQASARYRALLERGASAIGGSLRDFRHFRVSVKHPPFGNFMVVDWPLPMRPSTGRVRHGANRAV